MSFWSSTPEERREYIYDEYLSDDDFQQASYDYVKGLLTGGITSGYAALSAVARGDWEEVGYWAKVEAAVLGTQYLVLQSLNFIQGPKYAMNFHTLHPSLGPARGIVLRSTLRLWAPVAVPYLLGTGMKYLFGSSDHGPMLSGSDVPRDMRIEQYSGYKVAGF